MVRQFTIGNITRIKNYIYLKNCAMYSILCLGTVMTFHAFHFHIPDYVSPVITILVIGYFMYKSWNKIKEDKALSVIS